ncbi:MAG: hypothetical protein D6748_16045 [Calditrichaeota bacterium]|nr:MAG: hypothetical protein D6748_16045 [Calditrichota bacterium]
MKQILFYILSFIVILAIMTFLVAKFQYGGLEPQALADSTEVVDSVEVTVDSTAIKMQLAEETIQKQLRLIDSLKALARKYENEKETLSRKLEQTQASIAQQTNLEFEKRTKEMARIYENMTPQEAAAIISNLNDDVAISVISKMKKRKAAKILEALDPVQAVRLSELMAQANP